MSSTNNQTLSLYLSPPIPPRTTTSPHRWLLVTTPDNLNTVEMYRILERGAAIPGPRYEHSRKPAVQGALTQEPILYKVEGQIPVEFKERMLDIVNETLTYFTDEKKVGPWPGTFLKTLEREGVVKVGEGKKYEAQWVKKRGEARERRQQRLKLKQKLEEQKEGKRPEKRKREDSDDDLDRIVRRMRLAKRNVKWADEEEEREKKRSLY
ncbi:hypothetical protein BJY04DRAFT_215286 [Aspergillus karnatakaensis]|uniref:uncharacterized protein n=1 Tax=Aspergillus karnatakaensis TaxID=1810916 RepID=UPI003CCD4971